MNYKQRSARNAKVKHFKGRVWGGYLTPIEIISFIDDDGFQATDPDTVDDAREQIRQGTSISRYFYYFSVPKGSEL